MARRYQSLNELHFVERDEFIQMAPTVVQLEITRLTKILGGLEIGSDNYNSIVAARFQLRQFLNDLTVAADHSDSHLSVDRLNIAIMCISAVSSSVDTDTCDLLIYVADRLGYILSQMSRLR